MRQEWNKIPKAIYNVLDKKLLNGGQGLPEALTVGKVCFISFGPFNTGT